MDDHQPDESESVEIGTDAGLEALPDGLATTPAADSGSSGGMARRVLVVLAVFGVVVAGAIAFALAGGGGDGGDAATESDGATDDDTPADVESDGTDSEGGDESSGDRAEETDTEADTDSGSESSDLAGTDAAAGYTVVETAADVAYYGGEAPMVWGDGFLSIRQEFVPSNVTLPELIPDSSDRFPPEITDVIDAAGIDLNEPGAIDEAIQVLIDANLYDQAVQIFTDDPELMDAVNAVMSGGTYVQVAEYSADGITWEPIDFTFALPESAYPEYRSTGEHLIAFVSNNGWTPNGERVDAEVSVYITSDLANWTTVELPIDTPSVPDYVQLDVWLEQLAVGPSGWYVAVNGHQYIDLWALLPERLREGSYGWNPTPEGIRIEEWDNDAYYEAELAASESGDYSALDNWEPIVVEVVAWEDLPLTYEEWIESSSAQQNTYQAFFGGFDGSVVAASVPGGLDWFQVAPTAEGFIAWGQTFTPSDVTMQELVPDIEERFPAEIIEAWTDAGLSIGDEPTVEAATQILADAGLLDLATDVVTSDPELWDAYTQITSGGTYEAAAYFSVDGSAWSPITLPSPESADSVVAVDGGVLVIGSSSEGGQQFWLGDARGASWEAVSGPDLGEYLWVYFDTRSSNGKGIATVIDAAAYSGPDFVSWTSTTEHDGYQLTLSADGEGSQTLTIVEIASGDTVRNSTVEMWTEQLFVWTDETADFSDDNGDVIVSLPMEQADVFLWQAESEAWEEWQNANPYIPELMLVASVDGRNWVVQKLDVEANEEAWYGGGGAAINGDVAVYRDALGWHRVVLG